MADDPTEAMIRAEVTRARRILREDRIIAGHTEVKAKLDKHFPDEPEPPPVDPDAPPVPPVVDKEPPPKKKGLWWKEGTDEQS